MVILTLNCGSSSIKYSVYDAAAKRFACKGLVDRVGLNCSTLNHAVDGGVVKLEKSCPDHHAAVEMVLEVLCEGKDAVLKDSAQIKGVGHRVVHGGEKFHRSALVTSDLLKAVEEVSELAPLHNPPNLSGIAAAQHHLPNVPHVAVFDTAFHQTMPSASFIYALPYEWYEKYGIRRYGFHGTSHLYVSRRAAVVLRRPLDSLKLVTLHIGNGASAAAISGGKSVDTSMGFTPLEGLVMGTRCGSIDPAIPQFVEEHEKVGWEAMDHTLNKRSGLLGITGKFSDRREIQKAAAEGDRRCQLAIDIETRVLRKYVGAYAAAMGGLDAVAFTAGVGENSAMIRERVLSGLEFLGLRFDAARNAKAVGGKSEDFISTDDSPVKALVIPTNEELVITEDTLAILEGRFDRPDFRYSFELGVVSAACL